MAFLRRLVVDLCRIPGVRLFRTFSGKVRAVRDDGSTGWIEGMPAGTADILGIGPGGVFIAIEVKSKRGTLSKAQKAFLAAMLARGGISMVARQEFTDMKRSLAHARAMLESLIASWRTSKRAEALREVEAPK